MTETTPAINLMQLEKYTEELKHYLPHELEQARKVIEAYDASLTKIQELLEPYGLEIGVPSTLMLRRQEQ